MALDPRAVRLYHITDVTNLPGILAEGCLWSDSAMAARSPTVIGYSHIKRRRLTEYRVPCCGGRFVGEFVPFFYCPRPPMLLAANSGRTERPAGCQRTIVHLVTTVHAVMGLGREWAISNVSAATDYAIFASSLDALDDLDWSAIRADYWQGRQTRKAAEFLVADACDWGVFDLIGCHNREVKDEVEGLLAGAGHRPTVRVERGWYYP